MSDEHETPPPGGQFIVYQTADGTLKIDVRFEGETVWLTQQQMAELFQTSKQNIGQHLKSIIGEGELVQDSVVKDFFTTAVDGKKYNTHYYNLDAIISVGYRVKSVVATRFRIWATQRLREYIVKGFILDDERLKNPDLPFDYFEELMRRIQDIRTSERLIVETTSAPRRGRPITAQGRDRRSRTLGQAALGGRTLKGFHTSRAVCNPFRVGLPRAAFPRVRSCVATLGCDE